MELNAQLKDCKQTISELEDAQELNEELDFRQRQQIEADRSTLATLNITINAMQQQIQDKENTILDLQKKVDQARESNLSLKAEVTRLTQIMSTDFQEAQKIGEKIKKYHILVFTHEELQMQLQDVVRQLSTALAEKRRFQTLSGRMELLFHSFPVYLEESKLVSQEVLVVSAAIMACDVSKQVHHLISKEIAHHAMEFSFLCKDSLCIQAVLIQMILNSVTNGVGLTEEVLQAVLETKAVFTAVGPSILHAIASFSKANKRKQELGQEDIEEIQEMEEKKEQEEVLREQGKRISDLLPKLLSVLAGRSADGAIVYVDIVDSLQSNGLRLELILLLAHSLLHIALVGQDGKVGVDILRGGKQEVEFLIRQARNSAGRVQLLKHADALRNDILVPLVTNPEDAFLDNGLSARWKNVCAVLGRISSAMKMNNQYALDESHGEITLRFFPPSALGYLSNSPLEEATRDEIFLEKYWYLLQQGCNDLLEENQEVGWRQRIVSMRASLVDRFNSSMPVPVEESSLAVAQQPPPLQQSQGIPRSQYDATLHELEVKKDELRIALDRVAELQDELSNVVASKVPSAGNAGYNSVDGKEKEDELKRLRQEVETLEAALRATEARAETFAKEVKTLKQAAEASSPTTTAVATKPLRRSSQSLHNLLAETGLLTNPGGGSEKRGPLATQSLGSGDKTAVTSSSPLTVGAGAATGGVGEAVVKVLAEEVDYWRSTALRRLTQSLAPLPSPSMLEPSPTLPRSQCSASTANRIFTLEVRSPEEARQSYFGLRRQRILQARVQPLPPLLGEKQLSEESKADSNAKPFVRQRDRQIWIRLLTQPLLST
eukprot:scaffold1754_cov180-Ochromonas_danica.AAC.17